MTPEAVGARRDLTMFLATNQVILTSIKNIFFPDKNKGMHEVKKVPECVRHNLATDMQTRRIYCVLVLIL